MSMNDMSDVGQDKTHKEAVEKYDAEHGTYKESIDTVPTDDRLPTAQMPKAPESTPFVVGPLTPGGRSA